MMERTLVLKKLLLKQLLIASALFVLGGCTSIEPWVKPYERHHLADPIMNMDRDPVASGYLQHVLDAREAARGGDGGAGGGCGCN
jgi:hypothetical protein